MTSELEPSITDKIGMLKDQHFPLVERSEIVDATYDIPNLGPWDMNFAGMPRFGKISVVTFLCMLYVVFAYAANQLTWFTGIILERVNIMAVAFGFVIVGFVMWIFISLNWGTFSRYKRVIDYVWRYLDRRPIRKGEFRVEKITQIYPMAQERLDRYASGLEDELYENRIEETEEPQLIALPGVGSKLEKSLKSKGFDKLSKIARANKEDREKLIKISGINEDKADILIAGAKDILLEQVEDLSKATDKKLEEAAEDALMELSEIEKLSSTYRLDRMVKRIKGITKAPSMKDPVKDAINLKLEFIRIVRSLDSQFTYSIMECAGGLYILVISRFSLTGGDDDAHEGGFVEHRDHTIKQRTYVYQEENKHGTWGVYTHLADYKYLEVPKAKYLLSGKEERVRYAPICFLNYSDGQAEMDDEQIRDKRWTPEGKDVLQAELVYGASVAEKSLELVKLLTATVSRLKDTIGSIWREAMDWAKGVIAKAVEKIMLEEKLRREPGLRSMFVNLMSSKAARYMLYIFGIIGLYLLLGYAIGVMFPNIKLFPWDQIGGPSDGGGSTPDPYNP